MHIYGCVDSGESADPSRTGSGEDADPVARPRGQPRCRGGGPGHRGDGGERPESRLHRTLGYVYVSRRPIGQRGM